MTAARLRVDRAARTELQVARRYYAAQRVGLGRAFLAEVDAAVAFALEHPELYEAFSADDPAVRRALLHRFPCVLVYETLGPRARSWCSRASTSARGNRPTARRAASGTLRGAAGDAVCVGGRGPRCRAARLATR